MIKKIITSGSHYNHNNHFPICLETSIFIFIKKSSMSLPSNNKNDNIKGGKSSKNTAGGSKFITKPTNKSAGTGKKPVKTGGSRGS
jgi:hypothetical protein